MQSQHKQLHIEVAYAYPQQSHIIPLVVDIGTSFKQAIESSGILGRCPEIDLDSYKVGVFSKIRDLGELVSDGDRIEIYRNLIADPKQARRRRAELQKSDKR